MEINTIIGIVIAVIIILLGLRMILKKPNDAAPSLDSELHVDPDSKQPVIPRHVRDQLPVAEQPENRIEPVLSETKQPEEAAPPASAQDETPVAPSSIATVEDHTPETEPAKADAVDQEPDVAVKKSASEKVEPELSLNPELETAQISDFDGDSSILDVHLHEQQRQDDESALANAQYIIALNVYPNPRRALSGDKTLKVLMKYGLRYGEMSCFHRYLETNEPSPLMFSVLRITDEGPAGFDLETLSTEQVQGLAFFLALPNPHAQTGFDMMASIAGLIAREIEGKVYDENNLEFTPQLKEHWRHQVIDYRPAQENV